jgi:hypothetical protein
MPSKSKTLARPTSRAQSQSTDPLGFAPLLAEISAQLEEAYQERLHDLLRQHLLVRFESAVLQRIVDGGTAQEWPVTLPATLIVYPRDASGFVRVDGALETPAKRSAKSQADNQDGPEYGPWMKSIFGGEFVRARRPKRGWRNRGRRR